MEHTSVAKQINADETEFAESAIAENHKPKMQVFLRRVPYCNHSSAPVGTFSVVWGQSIFMCAFWGGLVDMMWMC